MRFSQWVLLGFSGAGLVVMAGCAGNTQYASAPPPPPPVYDQGPPPIVQLGERNGFETGRSDGARDAYDGRGYRARSTRAYRDTPGYSGQLGPYPVYRDAFRNAYLRGYDKGFHRG